MRKRRVLKMIVKSRRFIDKVIVYLFGQPVKENILLSKERQIVALLFNDIETKQSIELYKQIGKRFSKELNRREKRATEEVSSIQIFKSDDSTFENGELSKIEFQKI